MINGTKTLLTGGAGTNVTFSSIPYISFGMSAPVAILRAVFFTIRTSSM